ncbi:MAG: type II toxin-antitoxin system HicB family antitoxin [Clostridia bacterium]|nr:type II toxin-antitoxin system HicB family antitoxin [Clostridia bacterium]
MKSVYPIVMTQNDASVIVFVPDFDINTYGKDYYDAIEMARDAICLAGICFEDKGLNLPVPSDLSSVQAKPGEVVTLVDVNFDDYRRKNDMRSVRRNVTLPAYLDYAASESGINVSAVLQNALKKVLNIE